MRTPLVLLLAACVIVVFSSCSNSTSSTPEQTWPQRLAGEWAVSETTDGKPTASYNATITAVNDTLLNIVQHREEQPVYFLKNIGLAVNDETKEMRWYGTTVSGTLIDESSFTVKYDYGAGMKLYKVVLDYKRK